MGTSCCTWSRAQSWCASNSPKAIERSTGPGGVMYGPTCCAAEASKNNPGVVKNADNYRLYADQFLI